VVSRTVFVSIDLPADLRGRVEDELRVVDVPVRTSTGLSKYGDPVAWLVDPRSPVSAAMLDQLPSLRAVSQLGVGYDTIDVAACTARGIAVCNTPGVLDDAVAETVLGMILAVGRNLVGFDRWVRAGQWREHWPWLTHDVHRTTVGIVGLGRIGRRVAELLAPLGVRVLYHNRRRVEEVEASGLAEYADWQRVFAEPDFVVLTVPLTPETRGLVGSAELGLMRGSAYLVNVARGAVLDEPALVDAISQQRIAGAALDVYWTEPLPPDSPLLSLDGVVLLPHIASGTVETRRAMAELAVDNLCLAATGRPPRECVNIDPAQWARRDPPAAAGSRS
jgi:lactate dehydrogenase-like 2-hydroxyacid dehydrogenase